MQTIDRTIAHIIGIDGGADILAAAGITPDAVMGDLDSLQGEFKNQIKLDDQNQSDLEKSIVYLIARGVKEFTVYGALGGLRMDHAIANLDLLTRYAPQCRMTLVHDNTLIDGLSVQNTAPLGLELAVRPQSNFGILSIGETRITLRGALFELDNEILQSGTHGVGNTAVGDRLHIQIHQGLARLVRTEI